MNPVRGEQEISSYAWRCPANGGVNVLYCYLGAHGIQCQYGDLVRHQLQEGTAKGHTAITLTHLAAKTGRPLRVVSLTMHELTTCSKPVIVHMDGRTPEAGAFLLVLNISETAVIFVNGPTATIQTMSRESFRRVWSGIALLPVSDHNKLIGFSTIGFSIGLIAPLVIRSGQSKIHFSRP